MYKYIRVYKLHEINDIMANICVCVFKFKPPVFMLDLMFFFPVWHIKTRVNGWCLYIT